MESKLPFEKINREILVKKEAKTNGTLKEIKAEELINYGIVNIDKPAGPTSHQVSDYVQKILGISKAGHSGTLDPGVTGVLPIALGRATRIVQNLLTAGKEYVALMHLHKKVDEEKLRKIVHEKLVKLILLNRNGELKIKPGYDGVYGQISLDEKGKVKVQKSLGEF